MEETMINRRDAIGLGAAALVGIGAVKPATAQKN